MQAPNPLKTTIKTSLSLIDQFLTSLDLPSDSSGQQVSQPSSLHLLVAAVNTLKSTTTKISLLTITAPFTATAVVSTLQPLNNSTLPSLVTAILLTTAQLFPETFVKECRSLARVLLRDFRQLLVLIQTRSESDQPEVALGDVDKQRITTTTGKVWDDCDLLLQFAQEDVCGFVIRKAKSWLDLMKDAVKELENWDPEEEDDIGDQDWLGLDDQASSEGEEPVDTKREKTVDKYRATISAGVKDQALKVLSRIPQSVHVVIKQRLEKYPSIPGETTKGVTSVSKSHQKILDLILKKTRKISDCIDESAEALYLGDPELCLKKAGEARALTIDVVESTIEPWIKHDTETKEDQYIKRALTWIQQVNTGELAAGLQDNKDIKG